MEKPCVVVELDPSDLDSGVTVLTAALSLFHRDVEVVITLTGVAELSREHGEGVTRLCADIGAGAPLPDIVLETQDEVAARAPLLTVQATDDPAGVVEAVVLLASIALRSWQAGVTANPAQIALPEAASGDYDGEVAAWRAERDALVAQRDEMRLPERPLAVAGVVTCRADLMDLDPVLRELRQTGAIVDVVILDAPDEAAVRRDLRASGWANPRRPVWLASRFADVSKGLVAVLYTDAGSNRVPEEISPVRAAEFGVRVVDLAMGGMDVDPSVPPRRYDSAAQRVAWRIYAGSPRVEALFGNLAVGQESVRLVGSPTSDRAIAVRAAQGGHDDAATRLLWCPSVWRRGGRSDVRLLASRMVALAESDPSLRLIVRLNDDDAALARLGENDPGLRTLRDAAERLPNVVLDDAPDVVQTLTSVDALIARINGPIVEAVVIDVPHLCVYGADSDPIPEGAQYLLAGALSADGAGLEEFVSLISSGQEPWASSRTAVRTASLADHDGHAAETMADDILFSIVLEEEARRGATPLAGEVGLLSVAMIVKNEAKNLAATLTAIGTLGSLVSEVCVYDTGSTDDTVAIARQWGAKVQEGHWDDDFARARNAAIDMCSTPWVLIVDADEHVRANVGDLRRTLRQALTARSTAVDALGVTVSDVGTEGQVVNAWPSRRLLRPSRAHYKGSVHEDIYRLDGGMVRAVELRREAITIDHHGYADAELLQRKLRRNHEIADVKVASSEQTRDTERLIQALVDRARSAVGFGDIAAARADFARIRDLGSSRTYRWWGMEQFAELLLSCGEVEEAREVVDILIAEDDTNAFVSWLRARLLTADDRPDEAYELLARIDILDDALGLRQRDSVLLGGRMRSAISAGRFDEAIADLVPLMSTHGVVRGHGAILLKLWGQRPPEVLAELLAEGAEPHMGAIVDELAAVDEQGRQVAELVRLLRAGTGDAL